MNKRKLSKLWSSLFAVVMLLVGSSTAFGQAFAVYDQSGNLIPVVGSPFPCTAVGIQSAFNSVPANGEVRQLVANCSIAGGVAITTSQNVKLTAGAGSANLEFTGNAVISINGGTFTLGSGNNNIDLQLNGIGSQMNIANGATLELSGVGNNLGLNFSTAQMTNNGTVVTGSPRVAGAADVLGGVVVAVSDLNAPSGVYASVVGVDAVLNTKLAGTGTWGNIFLSPSGGGLEYDVTANMTLNIAADREFVVMTGADLEFTAAVTLNFNGPTVGAIDVQFQDESVILGSAGNITTNGNAYLANDLAVAMGALNVSGDLTFLAAADIAGGANTFTPITVQGNLSVLSGAFTAATTVPVTVWGNVNITDTNFIPNLTMTNNNVAAHATINSSLAGHTGTLVNNLNVTSTANGDETVTFVNSFTVAGITTLASHIVIPTAVNTVFAGVVNVSATSTITKNGTGTVDFDGNVNNSGVITHNGSGLMDFDAVTNNNAGGIISNSGLLSPMSIDNLDNAATAIVRNTSTGTVVIDNIVGTQDGTISGTGAGGSVIINDSFTNAGTGTLSNSAGVFTVNGDVTNSGVLARTGGTFTIDGDLTNNNNSTGSITNSSSTFGGGAYATRLTNAATDGIIVTDTFTQNGTGAYTGNVIIIPDGLLPLVNVAGAGVFGNLSISSNVKTVALGNNITVARSLVLLNGTFNLASFNVNMTTTGNDGGSDPLPTNGILMASNTMWSNGQVNVNTSSPAGLGFFQASAGVPAGSFFVNAGQVQLLSNVNVSNITVAAGATVRKQFNALCYVLTVAGTSTINGAILDCFVFTITNNAPSIRAQLIANGFDPDNMNQSIQIAIGAGNTIQLTDAGAEGTATQSAWLGVTIVNTQSIFIMSSGTVNLNDANLNLRGGFVYGGNWTDATEGNRTRLTVTTANNNNGGWLVFTGLNVPNADFVFIEDGVNSTIDGFVIPRLRFNRTGNSPISIVDNNNVNVGATPSSVVVSEKLEVNGSLMVGDNNIKWIGGNNTAYTQSIPANRSINLNTSDMLGSGFFWLANDDQNPDQNTITVNGQASGTDLQMQFKKTGDAGNRTIAYATKTKDQLVNITTIGNGGMNYVEQGWLVTNQLTLVDGDFTLGVDQLAVGIGIANLEVVSGLTFSGNLFILDNNTGIMGNPKYGTASRLLLVAGAADRVTTVKGIFQTGAGNVFPQVGYVQTGVNGNFVHNLRLENRVVLGANNENVEPIFRIARPSRVVFASTANRTFENVGGVVNVRMQRVEFSAGSTTTEYIVPATLNMEFNDLLLTNGLVRSNGNVDMVDLSATGSFDGNPSAVVADPSFAAGSNDNLSIVTRSRTATTHGQITRGLGSFGAYTSFNYNANGGAPYTVQHIGSASRFTGDEVPGLNVTNASGNGNNSVLNRLVIDVATGTEFELAKDLIVLTRMEALSGSVDIVASAFLDIAPNVQWVHGHAVLTDVANTVIRFPNVAGNTATGAGAAARYDLLYVSKQNHTTGYEYKSGVGVRDLTVITAGTAVAPISVTLNEGKEASGSVRVVDGVLNLNSNTLKITGNLIVDGQFNGNMLAVGVNNNGNGMVSGWFPGRAGAESPLLNPYNYGVGTFDNGYGSVNDANGTLEFVGTTKSYILAYVQSSKKDASLPNVVVTKTGANGQVVFDIDEAFTAFPDETTNRFFVRSFLQNSGRTDLRPGATFVPALDQSDAPASGAQGLERPSEDVDAFAAGFVADRIQEWNVRQNMTLLTGDFFAWGAWMTVEGNYLQGDNVAATSSRFLGGQGSGRDFAGNGQTDLTKQVNGNFTVVLDLPAADAAATTDVVKDGIGINRYYLSNGWLGIAGDYSFFGHADVTSGIGLANSSRGFRGTIEFNRASSFPETAALQSVIHVQNFRAFFEDVTVNGRGIQLAGADGTHMWVNDRGTFTFALGNVVTGPGRELILQNADVDMWQANSIVSGAVRLSGSNSFVEGNLRRYMSQGGTTGGLVEDGYIFPLGQTFDANDAPAFSGTTATQRYYRPLTLQFPQNLGLTINAVATTLTDMEMSINPALKVQGRSGTNNNPGPFYTIDLTTTSDMYWNIKFNQLPALEPNIRLGVQGLLGNQNSDIDDMRIVTPGNTLSGWRLAGVYDLTTGGPDDTYNPNDFIDGIPTFIQEGPGLVAQQYNPNIGVDLRIGTNALSNPFDGPGTIAYLQLIHNSPAGAVDVLINGILALDNFAYQNATSFIPIVAETPLNIEVKNAAGTQTLLAINGAILDADKSYILIAQGGANNRPFEVKVVDNARRTSTNSNAMQFFFSHGVTSAGTVSVERVTTSTPRTLEQLIAVNAAYGTHTSYLSHLNPSISTLQLKSGGAVLAQYLFDFGNYAGETMTLLATGGSGANALTIMGVDADGNVIFPQVTTSDDEEVATELPTEFTLYENFPNPFNPTTNIRFDLPEQANVRVEIVDLLGRVVMNIAPQSMSAGNSKIITVNATRMSSGAYFYRVIAEGSTRTYMQGGKFMLMK